MGSLGRDEGIHVGGTVKHLPIEDGLRDWEVRSEREARQGVGNGKVETAALFDKNGNPIDAYVLQCGGASGRAYVKTKITDDINIGSSLSMGDSLTRLYHGKVENQTYGNGLIEGGLNLTLLSKVKLNSES